MPTHIPAGWALVRLTDVARLESGHTPSRRVPAYWKGDVPWISLHDSGALDVPEIVVTAQTLGELGLQNSSARLLPRGTVVFSRTATVGKSTVMGRDMATSQDFANYVCGEQVHNHFLVHLFRFLAPEWKRLMSGSTLNTIYMPVFRDLQVLLPPLPEQEAIATALSDMDLLLAALDGLISKKRDLKQAAMQRLLTGQTRLPGFSGKWDSNPLASVLSKGRLGGNYANQDTETEYPLIKMGNIGRGDIDVSLIEYVSPGITPDPEHRLRGGDVLFNTRNTLDLVGKVGIWRNELPVAYFNSNLMRLEFKPEQVCNEFANYALNTWSAVAQLRALATGTTSVAAIYTRDLMRMPFAAPPLEEQMVIANVLSDMDQELRILGRQRDKTQLLKQGMMQELLTGRTRLV